MTKVYAIVRPSSYFAPGLAALTTMFTDIYHYFKYPAIRDYSLGHKAEFYDTLADAKEALFPREAQKSWRLMSRYRRQDAILELEVKDEKVVSITSIHKFNCFNSEYYHNSDPNPHFIEVGMVQADITVPVLDTLSDMLAERYVAPHKKDKTSNDPKAQLCRQHSAKFKAITAPQREDHFTVKEALLVPAGSISIALACIAALEPAARPLALVLFTFGVGSIRYIANQISKYQEYDENKHNYIRSRLFASHQPNAAAENVAADVQHNRKTV